ncbi:hypothetical protein HD806DRAFT_502242, partial [Xylariaceae sp. AK1471]
MMMPTQRQNPVRRPHSKSRTGCRVCKSRRVKCDETRPSCRRCLTYVSKPMGVLKNVPRV